MTYGLVATTALAINASKGRAHDQPVAVSLHDPTEWHRLVPCLDLPPTALDSAVELLGLHLSVLLPLRPGTLLPGWLSPAVRAGRLFVFNGRWAPTAAVWDRFPRLYGSSANRTGQPPATSAAQARRALGPDCVVIDGDALAGGSRPLAASTVVRLDRRGELSLHRSGAHDQAVASQPDVYLGQLAGLVGLPVRNADGDLR